MIKKETMKERKLFYRKKGKATILSGKHNGITTDIWTLPDPNRLALAKFDLVSFLTQEKLAKIMQKIECLDYQDEQSTKQPQEVPTIVITRTQELDTKQAELNRILAEDDN
jgi:hypothetical protein